MCSEVFPTVLDVACQVGALRVETEDIVRESPKVDIEDKIAFYKSIGCLRRSSKEMMGIVDRWKMFPKFGTQFWSRRNMTMLAHVRYCACCEAPISHGSGYPIYSDHNNIHVQACGGMIFRYVICHNVVSCIGPVMVRMEQYINCMCQRLIHDGFSYALSVREYAAFRGNDITKTPTGMLANIALDITLKTYRMLFSAYLSMEQTLYIPYKNMFNLFDMEMIPMVVPLPTKIELDQEEVNNTYFWFHEYHKDVPDDHHYRNVIHNIYKFLIIRSPDYDENIGDHYIQAHTEYGINSDARGHYLFYRTFEMAMILWYALGNPYRNRISLFKRSFVYILYPHVPHYILDVIMKDYRDKKMLVDIICHKYVFNNDLSQAECFEYGAISTENLLECHEGHRGVEQYRSLAVHYLVFGRRLYYNLMTADEEVVAF
jgi:hypothetical protein